MALSRKKLSKVNQSRLGFIRRPSDATVTPVLYALTLKSAIIDYKYRNKYPALTRVKTINDSESASVRCFMTFGFPNAVCLFSLIFRLKLVAWHSAFGVSYFFISFAVYYRRILLFWFI